MINEAHFTILAGDSQAWNDELRERCAKGESLPEVQRDQHRRGFREAILVQGFSGWYVRAASGLISPEETNEMARETHRKLNGTAQDAMRWGKHWAEKDILNREFFASKADLARIAPDENVEHTPTADVPPTPAR